MWLYRFLLLLYPVDFRDEYGGEMVRSFRDRCRQDGALRVWMDALPDLAMTAWKEHMDTFCKDLRYSIRSLAKAPAFTAAAVVTLALGIGANTAIFSVVNGVLLEPLPYREPDRLVQIWEKRLPQNRIRGSVSGPDFLDWRRDNTVFESMAALAGSDVVLRGAAGVEWIDSAAVSAAFFHVLGIRPLIGREFIPEEETPGKSDVVILSYGIWRDRFGGDPAIVGRPIELSGRQHIVIGVLPDVGNVIRRRTRLWVPLALGSGDTRSNHYLAVFARMKHGVTLEQARAGMSILSSRMEQQYPNENAGHTANLFSLHEAVTGGVRQALLTLLGAVGLVLLVACANVANLFLARTAGRRREIAIRTALGAGAGRLIRQLLTESILLGLAGGAAGILLAYWGVSALIAASPGELPRLESVQVDRTVLSFTLVISMLTSVLFALAPALYAARAGRNGALNAGRGSAEDSTHGRLRGSLVIAEVALALLLSIGSGLMMQSFLRLATVYPGFDPRQVLAIDVSLQGTQYDNGRVRAALVADYVSRVRALPGVISAGGTSALPLIGRDTGSSFQIEGRPQLPYVQQPNARTRAVTPGYFETMRIPLLAGRLISDQDRTGTTRVIVINETMARMFWPDEDPLGKRINGGDGPIEIVGVVGDVKHYQLDGETRPEMYLPHLQYSRGLMTIVVRTAGAPEALAPAARRELAALDKGLPVANLRTVEAILADSLSRPRLYSVLLGIFSGVALLLAAVGIYGVMSYAVGQRTRELGLRMALGAPAERVRGMILRQGLTLALAGIVLGTGGAAALTRVMGDLLFGVSPTDPLTFFGASVLLIAVAAAAAYFPARHATRVDPMVALRSE